MKISILTPSYNDSKSIEETLDSIRNQSYTNWESIIIDDGSTDDTKKVVTEYIKKFNLSNKIKYIYQKNSDQLNALINGSNYISGDYVFILHSDDLLPSCDFLFKAIKNIIDLDCDSIIGDLLIIDEQSSITNRWKALKYKQKKYIPVILMLNNGCNIYGDFSLQKREVFLNQVMNNYIIWNTPFWLDLNNKLLLNVKNVNFPILKYRVHSENYANNEIGKFNALNGELRTLTRLMAYYDIPMYTIQKKILQIIRAKGIRRLKLTSYFKPIYFNKPTKNKYIIIKQAILNTYGKEYVLNKYLNSLLNFYKFSNINRSIELQNLQSEEIYKGKDIRIFSNKLYGNNLPYVYNYIMEEMELGFSEIILTNKEDELLCIDLIKFLNIYPYVKITIK